jgi:transposase
METNLTDERARFVRDHESGHWSMTERCERYGVSRPTGYKWMARRKGGGDFADRSHAPHQCPHQTSADVEALIVAARQEYG